MPVTAWRICKSKHVATAFTGLGARLYGGRWNSPGISMVYVAENLALAALEMLVHLRSRRILERFRVIPVTFDDDLIGDVARRRLPRIWRADVPPRRLQHLGDAWIAARTSAVLRVPSVIIPSEHNFLLNPEHADFARIAIGRSRPFSFDKRLMP